MKKTIYAALLSTSLVAPAVSLAQANDSWAYSASVKMWNQEMTIDDGQPSSNTAVTPILGLSARKGQWFGVVSYFPKTNFAFWEYNDNGEIDKYTDGRDEFDIAVGYSPSALPGLSLVLGYKDIGHGEAANVPAFEAASPYSMNAPILGVSYTKSVTESVYIFSSLATNVGGSQKLTADWFQRPGTRVNVVESKPDYKTAEIGIGTVLNNGVSLGLGWRYQKLTLNVRDEYVALSNGDIPKKITEKGDGVTLTVGFGFN